MRAVKVSWILAAAFIGAIASLGPACGGGGDTGGSTTGNNPSGGGCTPGQTSVCACSPTQMGIQECQEDRTFSPCDCGAGTGGSGGGGSNTCGNNAIEAGEECDDGNMANGDGCDSTCQEETCGDGMPQPGECGETGNCQQDCGLCGNGKEDPGECGANGACGEDCCLPANTLIIAGALPNSGPLWQYGAFNGTEAGDKGCQAMFGADHACTYAEVVEGIAQNELAGKLMPGQTAWVHRTTEVMVNGNPSPPGAGCRCNDWQYPTNHASDGEYLVMNAAGTADFFFDNDCTFDVNNPAPYVQPAALQCGGESRAILCCYAQCVVPDVN